MKFNTPLIRPMPLHKLLSARSGKAGAYLGFIWGLIKRTNPKHNQTPQKNKPLKAALQSRLLKLAKSHKNTQGSLVRTRSRVRIPLSAP